MPRIITLDEIENDHWTVNINKENVTVYYRILDTNDNTWSHGVAIFWRVMPELFDPDGNPIPPPENWFLIPAQYVQQLVSLNTDIRTALKAKFIP